MESWVWFALDPDRRLASGVQTAGDAELLNSVLRGRGLEPLLVLPRARWQRDLAGGPPGVPPPVRTAAELAMLRADGILELPPMSSAAARVRHDRQPHGRHRWRAGRRHDAPEPTLAVHARPWSPSLVSVAVRAPGGEVLSGTERLFATDDDGLAAAAEWRGQLEFVCEQWLLDASAADSAGGTGGAGDDPDGPDARSAARLLGD